MKVDIYIHGVPNGQRIWSTGDEDPVMNQFYGTESEVHTKFLAEVRKSGGQNYCYYSLLKSKNVSAEDGRAGSYFGLSIRMDMVCTKVKVIFQILDMIYNNAVLGTILKKEGERLQYIVADFKNNDNQCNAIVEKFMSILGQSVEGNDFVNIVPSMLNSKGTPKVNIAEYTSDSAFACINQNGGIAVSAEYPSTQLASYIKKKDAEVSSIKQQASQNMQEQERKCNTTIQQIRDQATREVAQIKSQYTDIDKKITGYEQQIKMLETNNKTYQKTVVQLQHDVQERDITIAGLKNGGYKSVKPSFIEKIATQVLPFVNLLIGVAILAVMLFMMPSDNSKQVEQISNDIAELREKLIQEETDVDIDRIDSEKGNKINVDSPSIISAIDTNKDTITSGVWSCNKDSATIEVKETGKAILTAKKKGKITVTFTINDKSKCRTLIVE